MWKSGVYPQYGKNTINFKNLLTKRRAATSIWHNRKLITLCLSYKNQIHNQLSKIYVSNAKYQFISTDNLIIKN